MFCKKIKQSRVTGLEWPRGFQEVNYSYNNNNNYYYYYNNYYYHY
jgi:hypothetical protein